MAPLVASQSSRSRACPADPWSSREQGESCSWWCWLGWTRKGTWRHPSLFWVNLGTELYTLVMPSPTTVLSSGLWGIWFFGSQASPGPPCLLGAHSQWPSGSESLVQPRRRVRYPKPQRDRLTPSPPTLRIPSTHMRGRSGPAPDQNEKNHCINSSSYLVYQLY